MGLYSQDKPMEIVAIEKAIVHNDIKLLGIIMDDWVTITHDNKANIYNKYQAQNIIRGILPNDEEGTFTMQKIGKGSKENTYFAIGVYTSKNKMMLMYFYLVYNDAKSQLLVKEIKID